MTIVGFNFTKLCVEKKEITSNSVKIQNNILLKDVKEGKSESVPAGKGILEFYFEFKTNYDPDIGSVLAEGKVLVMEDSDIVKSIIAGWNSKKRTLPEKITTPVISFALNKSNIIGLILTREVNLPPNISLPKIRAKHTKK